MGWASRYIEHLQAGHTVSFRPRGHSMTGRIESGQLHLVRAIDGARFQIANNRGFINGWIGANAVFGKCTRVEP